MTNSKKNTGLPFFRSPPVGLQIPRSRRDYSMHRKNTVGKAGEMKGKYMVPMMMQRKEGRFS